MRGYLTFVPKEELSKLDGGYDYAMPQEVFDDICDKANANPCGHIVWYYPTGSIFGGPLAITMEGTEILKNWILGCGK